MDYFHFLYNSVFSKTIQSYFVEEPEKTNYEMFVDESSKFVYHLYDFFLNKNLFPDNIADIVITFLLVLVIASIVITAIRIHVTIKKSNLTRIRLEVGQLRFIVDIIARAINVVLDHQVNSLTPEDFEEIRDNRLKLEQLMFADDLDVYNKCNKRKVVTDSPSELSSEEEDIYDGPADKRSRCDSRRAYLKRYELTRKNTKENISVPKYEQDNEVAAERFKKNIEFVERPKLKSVKRLKEKLDMKTASQFSTDQDRITIRRFSDENSNRKCGGKDDVKVERTSGSAYADSDPDANYETSTTTEISDYDDNAIKHVEIFVPPPSKKLKSILKKRTRASIDDSDRVSEPSTPRQTSDSLESENDANGARGKHSKNRRFSYAGKKPIVRRMVKFWDEVKSNGNGTRIPHKAQAMITKSKIVRPKRIKNINLSSECDSGDSRTTCHNFNNVEPIPQSFLISDENTHCEAITKTVVVSEMEDGIDNITRNTNQMEMIFIPPLRIGKSKTSKINGETSEDSTPLTAQHRPNQNHNSNITTTDCSTPETPRTLHRKSSTTSKQSSPQRDAAKAATTTTITKKTATTVKKPAQKFTITAEQKMITPELKPTPKIKIRTSIPKLIKVVESPKKIEKIEKIEKTEKIEKKIISRIPRIPRLERSATTIPRISAGSEERIPSKVSLSARSSTSSSSFTMSKTIPKYATSFIAAPKVKQKPTEEAAISPPTQIPSPRKHSTERKLSKDENNKATEINDKNKKIRENLTIHRLDTILEELSGESLRSKVSDEIDGSKISLTSNAMTNSALSIEHTTIIPSVQPLTAEQRSDRIKLLSKMPVEKCIADISVHPRKNSTSSGIPEPVSTRRKQKKSKSIK